MTPLTGAYPINAFKLRQIDVIRTSFTFLSPKVSSQKASGLDDMCVKLRKLGKDTVAPILCKIFNLSLKQGCFSDDLKVARVIPIYKGGKQEEFSNYRPIYLFSLYFLKCWKRLLTQVHKQLYKYITDNNIMYDGQSCFCKTPCKTIPHALIKTTDKWNNAIDVGIGAVFVDLYK